MPGPKLSFLNHACFTVENDSALLLVDPWLEGAAFNHGWSLLDQSTSSAALVAQLNRAGLPVYIWHSHEQPDRFSIPFLKKFKEQFRGIATFLCRKTPDKRVAGFLRKNGFEVAECAEGEPVALGPDMRIRFWRHGHGGAWCLVTTGGRTILNLAGGAFATSKQCHAVQARLAQLAPSIDLMLAGFGYAHWVGNPEQPHLRTSAAHESIKRFAMQLAHFRPRIAVPAAPFFYFSHPENAWLNEGQNTPLALARSPLLARHAHLVRFMKPGDMVILDSDSAASLTPQHERALAHWMGLLETRPRLLPAQARASLSEVRSAFIKHRMRVAARPHSLPRLLELVCRISPLAIQLPDLGHTVQVSYRRGWKVLEQGSPFHVSMSSNSAAFLFRNEHGFATTRANGRFRVAQPDGMDAFCRFFLARQEAGDAPARRNRLAAAGLLVRSAAGRAARHLQQAFRLS